MAVPDLPPLSSHANQVVAKMLSSDILAEFPECLGWLKKHAADLHDWQIALPVISCMAAGGSFDDGIEIAAAWYPMYLASDLLDKVEDREFTPDDAVRSPEQAINLGTSLIFLSSHRLSLIQRPGSSARAGAIFSSQGFAATTGQHRDLLATTLSVNDALEDYWQAIILKSGSVFRAATAGGAAAGTSDEMVINRLGDYGTAVGVMLQLLDDGRDILKTSDGVIQGWEVSLPLLLYLLATGAENIIFPPVHSRTEWHACLREARILETFSEILLKWKERALESIHGLEVTEEKEILENFPVMILESIILDGFK